ncbi:MAG: hypothetical protein ABIB71_07890 [Candidatus Woesearchaeota archaeon]
MEETKQKKNVNASRLKQILGTPKKQDLGDPERWRNIPPSILVTAKTMDINLNDPALQRLNTCKDENEAKNALKSIMIANYCSAKAKESGKVQLAEQIESMKYDKNVRPLDIGMYAEKSLSNGLGDFDKVLGRVKDTIFKEERIKAASEVKRSRIVRNFKIKSAITGTIIVAALGTGAYFLADYLLGEEQKEVVDSYTDNYNKKIAELEDYLPPKSADELRELLKMPVRQRLEVGKATIDEKLLGEFALTELKSNEKARKELQKAKGLPEKGSKTQGDLLGKKLKALEGIAKAYPMTQEAFEAEYSAVQLQFFNYNKDRGISMSLGTNIQSSETSEGLVKQAEILEQQFVSKTAAPDLDAFIKKYSNSNMLTPTIIASIMEKKYKLLLSDIRKGESQLDNPEEASRQWAEKAAVQLKGTHTGYELNGILAHVYSNESRFNANCNGKECIVQIDPRLRSLDSEKASEHYKLSMHDSYSTSNALLFTGKSGVNSADKAEKLDGLQEILAAIEITKESSLASELEFYAGKGFYDLGDVMSAKDHFKKVASSPYSAKANGTILEIDNKLQKENAERERKIKEYLYK